MNNTNRTLGTMEPEYHKITLTAEDFDGGVGKSTFQAHERFNPEGGIGRGQTSSPKHVVSVTGLGQTGNTVTAEFDLPDNRLSSPECVCQHQLWICGMWDHYRLLEPEYDHLHALMPTFATFRIRLNDGVAFEGRVFYWNYRQWRFWPVLELPLDETHLRPGRNTLTFENLTPPFFDNIPDRLSKLYPDVDGNRCKVPAEIQTNTTFNLSDIQLVTRPMGDLQVLSAPDVVHTDQPFMVELFATRSHELDLDLPEGVEFVSSPKLTVGRNMLFFRIRQPAADIIVTGQSRDTHQECQITISLAVTVANENEFLLGHLLGGSLSVFPVGHDYNHAVELFRDTGQGNLLVWMTSPSKAGDIITSDMLPIEDIRRSGMKVVFRYYGGFKPEDVPYEAEVRKCMDTLKEAFFALAPHESGGRIGPLLNQYDSREEAFTVFTAEVSDNLAALKRLARNHLVWITDPSLYANVYRRSGADIPALELFPLQCNLNIASVRGTARMYGDDRWAAINSFECQAYGGLAMPEPFAEQDPRFDQKRADLWWFSQFHLYLAGARIIYSESGAFDQVVTRHLHGDDPPIIQFRQAQRDLFEFSRLHPLVGQPQADIAFVKPETDVFTDIYAPPHNTAAASDFSYERIRPALPQLQWRNQNLYASSSFTDQSRHYSDTPFGEWDFVTFNAPAEVLNQYRLLVLVGDHHLTRESISKLREFVQNGGHVIFSLSDCLDQDALTVPADELADLCGCRIDTNAGTEWTYLWEIESTCPDLTPQHLSSCQGNGVYGGLIPADITPDSSTDVLLRDRLTQTPFLTNKTHGTGRVWLINAAHHHDNRLYQKLINDIVTFAANQIERELTLIDGSCTNYFVYQHNDTEIPYRQVFVLNNDWFTETQTHSATFQYRGIDFTVTVPRGTVSHFYLIDEIVLLPDTTRFRIDAVRRTSDGKLQIDLQGANPTEITVLSPTTVDTAELLTNQDPACDLKLKPIENGSSISVNLAGRHGLVLRLT